MERKTAQILSAALFLVTLVWGGITLMQYVGVPVHGMVLVGDQAQEAVNASCPGGSYLCRGVFLLLPSLTAAVGKAAPLVWYIVLSVILYLLFVGWRALSTGDARLHLRWRPASFLLLFFVAVWLLFTTLSEATNNDMPVRQLVEPTPQAYTNIDAASLRSLQENFKRLKDSGCVTKLGSYAQGVDLYEEKVSCVQRSFFTMVAAPMLFAILFLFELLILGRFLLSLLRLRQLNLLEETVLSLGAGACGGIALLWILAIAAVYSAPAGWGLAAVVPLLLWKQSWYWVRRFFLEPFETDLSWRSPVIILGWILLSLLALNFLTVIRPFPIGWDDLGSYINRPRLMVSYGRFIFPMSPFQWEYLTSLGFLLFGYDSSFGATMAMVLNWTEGLLAVLAVLLFSRTFLGKGRGLLAGLLYYALPLVGHFSFADMKIDNAVFAMGALATYSLFAGLFPSEEETAVPPPPVVGWRALLPSRWAWFLLGGLFAGFAFGIKPTAAMVIMALIAVLLGSVHPAAFAGAVFAALAVFIKQGVLDLSAVTQRLGLGGSNSLQSSAPWVLGGVAILLFVFAAMRLRKEAPRLASATALFLIGMGLAVAPWILHNNILSGNVVPRLALSAPNNITPVIDVRDQIADVLPGQKLKKLPADLKVDPNNAACLSTGGSEELDRYWGFRKGWGHYLTLPWRMVMNADSAGYYVTTFPALLLFPLLLLLPYFWMSRGKWLRWMTIATAFLIVEWVFLGNGIPWYGIGMFLGLVLGLEAFMARAPDGLNRTLVGILIGVSLLLAFSMRMWQFDMQRNLLEYAMGKVSGETLRIRTIPYYDTIRQYVVERNTSMPDRPYLYRVGTFIPYFIPKNLELIGIADNQLDAFRCLYQERDPILTLKRLKALGFNSIIFDTNTATIEQDTNGSLHKKTQDFVDFLNTASLGLKAVVNDSAQGVVYVLIP